MTRDVPISILVIEDEFMIAMDLRSWLLDEGFDVIGPAASVASALVLLAETDPRACILDVNLRGQHSGPVAAALRTRGVPFILSSAYQQRDLDRYGAFEGVINIGKPASQGVLLAALNQLLQS